MIKKITIAVFVFFLFINTVFSQSLRYVSPLPNSSYNMEKTSLIFGFSDKKSAKRAKIIVKGSLSGYHSGRTFFADHGRKIIFHPDVPFSLGETVKVKGYHGKDTMSFYIRKNAVAGGPKLVSQRLSDELNNNNNSNISGNYSFHSLDTIPEFTIYKYGETSAGYLFLINNAIITNDASFLLILNDNGTPFFYRKLKYRGFDFKKQNNYYIYWDEQYYQYRALDSTGATVDSFYTGNGYTTDFHECILDEDNSAWLISYDNQYVDMSQIVPNGNPNAIVTGIIIQKIDENKNVVFQWRSWDHFNITDATHEDLTAFNIDYVHTNSIELDKDHNIIISSRHMDEITKINSETGEIMWRFGGLNNQFTFYNDSLGFSHQHAARVLPNGNLLLYDNGNFHPVPFSRAIEYDMDYNNMKAVKVWEYSRTPSIFAFAMGNAQRLPNGNTLIGWGSSAVTLSEVNPSGELVYDLSLPQYNWSYRAFRFEINSTITNYNPVGNNSITKYSLEQNYPNPFNSSTIISYSIPLSGFVKIKIFDITGRVVSEPVKEYKNAGNYSFSFDAGMLSAGIYFYRLETEKYSEAKKMIITK